MLSAALRLPDNGVLSDSMSINYMIAIQHWWYTRLCVSLHTSTRAVNSTGQLHRTDKARHLTQSQTPSITISHYMIHDPSATRQLTYRANTQQRKALTSTPCV